MANIITDLKQLISQEASPNQLFKRNVVKQYLQIMVLDFLYSHPTYSQLVFYGGTCLSLVHGLPRLSEDLDFVDLKQSIDLSILAKDLESSLSKTIGLEVKTTVQKFRTYLKFPLLHILKLSSETESDWLFIKVEIFNQFNFCSDYTLETKPLFKFNKSLLVKTFDLPTLMATKIRAVLNRTWTKTDKSGKELISVKGRDYFDLMWYLEKNVEPNYNCLEMASNKEELQKLLMATVNKLDVRSIQLDLESFIDNSNYISKLSSEIKDILERGIQNL